MREWFEPKAHPPPAENRRAWFQSMGSTEQAYWVYVLWSGKVQKRYIGSSDNPEERLREHNSGQASYARRKTLDIDSQGTSQNENRGPSKRTIFEKRRRAQMVRRTLPAVPKRRDKQIVGSLHYSSTLRKGARVV